MRYRLTWVTAIFFAITFSLVLTYAGASQEASVSEDIEVAVAQPILTVASDLKVPRSIQQAKIEPETASPWADYPNNCETFTVYQGRYNPKTRRHALNYQRNRFKRTYSDQRRTRELIKMVAREMGADPAVLLAIADHESTWNPEAIHILNQDLDANRKARQRFAYSQVRETKLRQQLSSTNARNADYWDLKRELNNTLVYKGNPFWSARVQYDMVIPARTKADGTEVPEARLQDWQSVWSYGYGLYGMNSVLYTRVLDSQAPPWALCGDEGITATIAAIWALRNQQAECDHLSRTQPEKYGTDGGSRLGVIRRWARGQCGPAKLGPGWQRVLDRHDFDWDAQAKFGVKFPQYQMVKKGGKWRYLKDEEGEKIRTDVLDVIDHMRVKAEEQELLRPEPLKRKKPGTAPVIARR